MSELKICKICGQTHECEHGEPAEPRPKQATRLIKCQCPSCGYTIRVTRKWLDTGLPYCPCETQFEEISNVEC